MKSGKYIPTTIPALPLTISLGAGTDLIMTSGVFGTPVIWACRPSTGTSATNSVWADLGNPVAGAGPAGYWTAGSLDTKRTLLANTSFGGGGGGYLTCVTSAQAPRFANRIISATDSETVNPANYSMWILMRLFAQAGSPRLLGTQDSGRMLCNMNDTAIGHNVWFATDSVGCNHRGIGVWQVLWYRFTLTPQIQIAVNDDAFTVAGAGLPQFPNGMNQNFLISSGNFQNEIADVGIMPGTISDVDRAGVMTDLRGMYPSAGL